MNNYAGKKYGSLTVMAVDGRKCVCACICGSTTVVRATDLKRGAVKSCGCHKRAMARNRLINLKGRRFGRLTVVERAPNRGDKSMWLCKCDCGKSKVVAGYNLKAGKSKSCGCLSSEVTTRRNTKHGNADSPLYHIWSGIKRRTSSPKPQYYKYSGRGIKVCEEWKNDPQSFIDWAMANGWRKGLEIDRIDVDGDYCPENCRFISKSENISRAQSCLISVDGITHSLREWSSIVGKSNGWGSYNYRKYGENGLIERIRRQINVLEAQIIDHEERIKRLEDRV